jgi:hypothetical protein
LSDEKRYVLRFGKIICLSFEKHLTNPNAVKTFAKFSLNSDAKNLSAPGSKFVKSSERSVSSQLVSKPKDPENIIGDPSQIKINKFQNLQISGDMF